ncbi:MAG: hypothetical protein JNL97_14325 [Verrucomicrobiales bacterium]|nr:hypothetical protein [Verrucomicrobiales bacterium]
MKIEDLRSLLKATPFVPFWVVLPNGEKLRIPHPEFAWIHPGERAVWVALESGGTRLINWPLVTGLEVPEPTA